MRRGIFLSFFVLALALAVGGCAGTPETGGPAGPPAGELPGFERALAGAVSAVEGAVGPGAKVAVVRIHSSLPGVADFLTGNLIRRLNSGGRLRARDVHVQIMENGRRVQMSGLADDRAAAIIGNYPPVDAVVTGIFSRFAGFDQLRLRVVGVEGGVLLASHSVRIRDDGAIPAISGGAGGPPKAIGENALEHLNRGLDLLAEGRYDDALGELDRALAGGPGLAECHYWRGLAHLYRENYAGALRTSARAIWTGP